MNHHRLLQQRLAGISIALALATFAQGMTWAADALEPLPEDPAVAAAVGDGTTEITQKREKNAVT